MPPRDPSDPRSDLRTTPAVDIDSMPGDAVPGVFEPMLEVGLSGLKRVSGYVSEEFLPSLKGRKGVQVFREMAENDPIAGGFLFAVTNLLRQIDWTVEPGSDDATGRADAEFLEGCMDDMSHSWSDMMTEIMTMLPYGWAWMEMTYKRCYGPWEKDAARRSQFNDGAYRWRKISLRAQETLHRWVFDEHGGIQAMVQMAPPRYQTTVIPIDKSLLFRVSTEKNNPEGRSAIRSMYWPWYMKKRLCEIESTGVERDLTGLPMATLPARYFEARPGSKEAKMLAAVRKIVRNVRRDENEGVVWPSKFDEDTKQQEFTFSLLTSGGSRQFNTSDMIQRYATWQLVSVLADFILLGHEDTGSYAMHTDKSGLFRTALNAWATSIADVFNRHAIPRLFAINGNKPDKLPRLKPANVENVNLAELAGFMTAMTQAGAQWFPDPVMEKFVRAAARLPELNPEQEAVREQAERQQEVLNLAQQQLQLLQAEQQAQQGALQNQQAQMGMQQQQAAMEADPTGQGAPDPAKLAQADATSQQAQLSAAESQRAQRHANDRDKIATSKERDDREHQRRIQSLKQQQERQKLVNMRRQGKESSRPPTKGAARKVSKRETISKSAFGVEH